MIKKLTLLLASFVLATPANAESTTHPKDTLQMNIIIQGTKYNAILENNETATTIQNMLPLTLNMSDLNHNEKYYYLDTPVPNNPVAVKSVSAGDIMLFGDDCLVIFYQDFQTPYQYTKIGHITDFPNPEHPISHAPQTIEFN